MLGSFLSGFVSDNILKGRRKPMILACFLLMIPFVIVLATLEKGVSPYIMLLTLTGAGFFLILAWGPAISLPVICLRLKSTAKQWDSSIALLTSWLLRAPMLWVT